jgi:hypothetical protein
MSQLLWADAVFVRDFTKIRSWSDGDLLKASLMLHTVFHSYDLVAFLLSEHDRRHAADLHDRYLAHLRSAPLSIQFMNTKGHP